MNTKSETFYGIIIWVQPGSAQYEVDVKAGITIGALKKDIMGNPGFGIPKIDAYGNPIIYRVMSKRLGDYLNPSVIVDGIAVKSGDVIILAPESIAGRLSGLVNRGLLQIAQ